MKIAEVIVLYTSCNILSEPTPINILMATICMFGGMAILGAVELYLDTQCQPPDPLLQKKSE
jgi:hypothetical protein